MSQPSWNLSQPFTRQSFRDAGHELTLLRRRDYVQIFKGVWMLRTAMDQDALIRAALLIHCPMAYASHLSAASVLRLPVPDHAFAHVTVPRAKDRRFRPQIKPHVFKRARGVVVVRGIRTTDPVATFIDCAGMLGVVDLVILGDALCKRYDIGSDDLRRACDASIEHHAGRARIAARYVRDGVDSPMETRLRMLIVLAGLPEPRVNSRIWNDDGTWRRRFDLCYERIKLIVEYDGRHHAADPQQWTSDLERREEFDDEGYRILVVTAAGIFKEPERTLHRIRRQLLLRGWGDVPMIGDLWREYFVGS